MTTMGNRWAETDWFPGQSGGGDLGILAVLLREIFLGLILSVILVMILGMILSVIIEVISGVILGVI